MSHKSLAYRPGTPAQRLEREQRETRVAVDIPGGGNLWWESRREKREG
jgi:hypothetical protein